MRRRRAFRTVPDFFRLAFESLAEYALVTTGTDLMISSWGVPARGMFGYSEEEVIGRSIGIIFTPEDIAAGIDKREFADALEQGRRIDQRWHVRKDGRRLWCHGLAFPLRDAKGTARGFVKLIRDDTERKSKDDDLREKEERLRLAAESTGLGLWDFDMAKKTFLLSARAAQLFGLGGERTPVGFERILEKVHSDDRSTISADFEQALQGVGVGRDMEYRIRTPDGKYRWVRTLARALYEDGAKREGPPRRLLGSVIDITEEHRKKILDYELNRELERRVKERTAQFQALNKELESFAYSASHDLRAPLRKISAFSQAILQSRESRISSTDQGYFERIMAATSKMHRLIDDMLNLTRVTRKPLVRAVCDLSATARAIADDLRRNDPRRDVDFVIRDDVRADVDCDLMTVALRSLLENAWKFTGKHPRARIEFGVKPEEGRPVYFVKDDGAGFDMRFAHKLFGAFRRLHSEEQFSGTGVGLGIVERIVSRHHGRIWAEAKVEEGATFYFTLDSESL